ncbi:hypothetical protein [Alkalimarinus coralli]|uniref:hypothetical protein n=1 Tax=Alkalimarinus coralli TaxID=2935863 RepID=UPI00202B41AE|nr:hypothetical protein [Alkalimarinus coralli]
MQKLSYTRSYKAIFPALTMIFILLLSGCGGGNEAVKAAGAKENAFARNAAEENEQITEGGTSDANSCSSSTPSGVTFCLTVEATEAMVASWQKDLFNLITPGSAYAFRGLTTVPAKSIEIIQVEENLNEVATSLIPSYSVKENAALGNYSITFDESPPARIDIIAKVTLENDQVLLAPFIDSSIEGNFEPIVVVNVVSDYLVKALYSKLNTPEALTEILPCSGDGSEWGKNVGCKSQPFAKFSLWAALNNLTQAYEIDIPSSFTITQASELLGSTAEFKAHIETVLNEIIRTPEAFVGGTERELAPVSENPENTIENLSSIESYNSTLFSLSFSQTTPASASKGASISTTISTLFEESAETVSYPELTRNTSNLNVSFTNINEDFPILRTSLNLTSANDASLTPALRNSLSSSPGNTFLTSQGFYIAGKIPFQTITDKTATSGIGWQSDPYIQLMYASDADGTGPQSMFSSFVRNGSSYAITANEDSSWARNDKLEEQMIFAWSSHNQVPENDGKPIVNEGEGFVDTSKIQGKEYGVVNLSVKLNNSGNILSTVAKLSKWNASSPSQLDQTQPGDIPPSGELHYQTYSFTRDDSQTLTVTPESSEGLVVRNYDVATSKKSSNSGIKELHLGRLTVSAPGNADERNQASSTPDGNMITVTQNETANGQGLLHAMKLRAVAPVNRIGAEYRLAGNSFGANAASNVLRNYNNSILSLTGASSATLTFNTLETTHNVSTQVVTPITGVNIPQATGSYTIDNDGVVQFTFPNVQGEPLKLKGFMSQAFDESGTETNEAGNLMTLLMVHGYDDASNTKATLGLVYALKEQSLSIEIE